jgi:hypothetical protein
MRSAVPGKWRLGERVKGIGEAESASAPLRTVNRLTVGILAMVAETEAEALQ